MRIASFPALRAQRALPRTAFMSSWKPIADQCVSHAGGFDARDAANDILQVSPVGEACGQSRISAKDNAVLEAHRESGKYRVLCDIPGIEGAENCLFDPGVVLRNSTLP